MLPEEASPKELHDIYTSLHTKACHAARAVAESTKSDSKVGSSISYNLGLTDRAMVLCPRLSAGIKITSRNGEPVGAIELNGTVLGGTLLVKNEVEWNVLRTDNSKLVEVLNAIGVQSGKYAEGGRL